MCFGDAVLYHLKTTKNKAKLIPQGHPQINREPTRQRSGPGDIRVSGPSRFRCLGIFILDHMTVGSVLNASRVTLLLRSQKGGIWVKDREAQGEGGGQGEQQNDAITTCCLLCRQTGATLTCPRKKGASGTNGDPPMQSVFSQHKIHSFFLYTDDNGCIWIDNWNISARYTFNGKAERVQALT